MNHIWRTLPDDIVIQHIMPYVYQKQSHILLHDIRNYYIEYTWTQDFYEYNYNQYVWFCDLINYFTHSHIHSTKGMTKLLKRHFIYKNKDAFDLFEISFKLCNKIDDSLVERKNRFLWGLMLPVERIQFCNRIIIK